MSADYILRRRAASLKLVKLSDLSVRELEVSASVVSVSFSSDDKLLCAVTSDGFVLVYALATLEVRAKLAVRRCLSSDSAVPPHCQFAPPSARTPTQATLLALPHFRDISLLDARTGKSTPFDKVPYHHHHHHIQIRLPTSCTLSIHVCYSFFCYFQFVLWNVFDCFPLIRRAVRCD